MRPPEAATSVARVNLATFLIDTAGRHPQRAALRRGGRRIAYAELDRASADVARRLAAEGIRPGDRVALMVPNVPEFVAAYYGILRAGAIVVPLDVDLKRDELRASLADAGAALLIAWRGLLRTPDEATWLVAPGSFFEDDAPAAEPVDAVDRDADDTAVIVYTSGSTGRPKGAELTHANLALNAQVVADLFAFGPEDAVLGALPLAHAFGQTCTLNAAMLAGARLVLAPRPEPDDGVSVLVGVPSMYARLLADGGPSPAPELRMCISGGAPLAPELLDACEQALGTRLLEGYGLTETSPVASFNRPSDPRRPGSIGTPIAGVEMRLRDVSPDGVGEIVIRGHNVMKGYWNRPEETRAVLSQDGWLRTGDVARVDEDGAFHIVGRTKDLIIRDGRNVYPREIEDVLHGHPDVLEAAVLGVPDPLLGEEVVACVVVAAGATPTEEELRDYVRERVAESKYPRRVWFAAALPHTGSGKVLKRAIVIPPDIAAAREIAA
jgi:long-chain acyl-CoA synthetase